VQRVISVLLAVLLSTAAAIAFVPLAEATGSAEERIGERLATVQAHLDDLRKADLPVRVSTLETDQRRQDEITGDIKATQKAILGAILTIVCSLALQYLGIRRHIYRLGEQLEETGGRRRGH
jgi:hypothetical protein